MKTTISSILLLSAVSLSIYAQESNNRLLDKLVEKQILTQSEAIQIANESTSDNISTKSFDQKVEAVREAFNTPYMKFSGYGLFQYKYSDISKVKHNAEPRVIYLNMGGKLLKNLSYSMLGEFIHPEIHEMYLEWTPSTAFNFKAGQFKVPLSLENQISLTNLETVVYSRSIMSLTGWTDDVMKLQNGKNNGGRDIGVMASGQLIPFNGHNLIEYSLGLFQGSGITTSEQNNTKDFAASILLQPTKGFRIGGSAYFGEATYSLLENDLKSDHVRNRWIVSADYKSEKISARTEWLHGKDSRTKKEGLYGLINYHFVPNKCNALIKVDYFNADTSNSLEVMDYTLAANYYFYKQCRFQLNYTYSDFSKKWGSKDCNTVYGQLQIVF